MSQPPSSITLGHEGPSNIKSSTPMEAAMSRLIGKMRDTNFNIKTSIRVNISGKIFEIENSKLMMHPDSLLASADREIYYDRETKSYFFDRNRQVFEVIMEMYQNYGQLRYPSYFQVSYHNFVREQGTCLITLLYILI